jgi:hypothetical protein
MLLNAQALVQHANCGEPGGGNTGQLRGKGEAADAITWFGSSWAFAAKLLSFN